MDMMLNADTASWVLFFSCKAIKLLMQAVFQYGGFSCGGGGCAGIYTLLLKPRRARIAMPGLIKCHSTKL